MQSFSAMRSAAPCLAAAVLLLAATLVSAAEPTVNGAVCELEATGNNALPLTGRFTFADDGAGTLSVTYDVTGLSVGGHTFHVHDFGDVDDSAAALSTGGHFVGECAACRPDLPQEVGRIGNGTVTITAASNGAGSTTATGSFVDFTARLNGPNSIVGRSMVVHGIDGDAGARAAMCVIGIANSGTPSPATTDPEMPTNRAAACRLRAVGGISPDLAGQVRFDWNGAVNRTDVSFFLSGLDNGTDFYFRVFARGDVGAGGPGSLYSTVAGDALRSADDRGVAAGVLRAGDIALNGPDSVVGRSLVLVEPAAVNVVVASCVIGVTDFGDDPIVSVGGGQAPALVAAEAELESGRGTSARGVVSLRNSGTGGASVRYGVAGLNPNRTYEWRVTDAAVDCFDLADPAEAASVFAGAAASTLSDAAGALTPNAAGQVAGFVRAVDSAVNVAGASSVVGRGVLLVDTFDDSVAAHGVFGRAVEHATSLQTARPAATTASVRIRETSLAGAGVQINGFATFSEDALTGDTLVRYHIRGLTPNSSYTWHVHNWGRTIDHADAQAVGGHFVGTCTSCRPVGALQEVGLLNDGAPLESDEYGHAYGAFVDDDIQLVGLDSIVGRGIIVHAPGGARVAQGVIGEGSDVASAPPPKCAPVMDETNFERDSFHAMCYLSATEANGGDVTGTVTFTYNMATGNVSVAWSVGAGGLSEGAHEIALHSYGDIGSSDASATGPMLRSIADFTAGAGAVSGSVQSDEITLNGRHSVIGRSVVIYGVGGDSDAPAAQCVIGRDEDEGDENNHPLGARRPRVKRAACQFVETSSKRADEGDYAAGGWMEFTTADGSHPAESPTRIRYFLWGLADGPHNVHVHDAGDIQLADGTATGNHFVGECDDCRATGVDEVGSIGDAYQIDVSGGIASGYIADDQVRLVGPNSVVGRSVIVHATVTPSRRMLQCVIGATWFAEREPLPPPVALISGAPSTAIGEDEQTIDTGGIDPSDDVNPDEIIMDDGNDGVELGVPYVTAATAVLKPTGEAPALVAELPAGNRMGGIVDWRLRYSTSVSDVTYEFFGLAADTTYYPFVREFGNLCGGQGDYTGAVADGLCNGTAVCRTGSSEDERKLGFMPPVTTDALGVARGHFVDPAVRYAGSASITGRSIVLRDGSNNVVATGAIGRLDETSRRLENPPPPVQHAACQLRATQAGIDAGFNVTGYIAFTETGAADGVVLEVYVTNAPPGEHSYHVHTYGDLADGDLAQSVGGHFVGFPPRSLRPAGLQEVGAINNGVPLLVSAGGIAYDQFRDTGLTLKGANSIVGRSVVVHGDGAGDTGVRIAQCVVGVASEAFTPEPFPRCDEEQLEDPEQAVCVLHPADPADEDTVTGVVSFVRIENDYRLTWQVDGLPSGEHGMSVRQYGNAITRDGAHAGGVYTGVSGGRDVGALTAFIDVGAGENRTSGSASDTVIRLLGRSSIVGRTLAVHSTRSLSSTVIASCVIGRADRTDDVDVPADERVRRARVEFQPADSNAKGGWMEFEDLGDAGVGVRYWLWGIDGAFRHDYHVHTHGDLRSESGADVGGHFIGSCDDGPTPCRDPPALAEIGYIGDGAEQTVYNRQTQGYIVDKHLRLYGRDSIIGRSVVVHGSVQAFDVYVAVGVVGIVEEGPEPDYTQPVGVSSESPPQVLRASCVLNATTNWLDTGGYFSFEQVPGAAGAGVRVTYSAFGLLPGLHQWGIHENGDQCEDDGSSLGEEATNPIVGYGNFTVASTLAASGRWTSADLSLSGVSSIIGRSLVVRGVVGDANAPAASCVIGRDSEHATNLMPDLPESRFAACRLRPTWQLTSSARPSDVFGYASFEDVEGGVRVRLQALNMAPSQDLAAHVHSAGNMLSYDNGAATRGHFIGSCSGCRPDGELQEIGLLNDGKPFRSSSFGTVRADFVDTEIKLSGPDGIVGRSVVFHDETGARIAQCVIGARDKPDSTSDRDLCPLLVKHNDPSSSSSASATVIALAAVGSILLLAIIGALVFVCCIAPRRRAEGAAAKMGGGTTAAGGTAAGVKAVELQSQNGAGTGGTLPDGATVCEDGLVILEGWEEHFDDDNNRYFYNVASAESIWVNPPGSYYQN